MGSPQQSLTNEIIILLMIIMIITIIVAVVVMIIIIIIMIIVVIVVITLNFRGWGRGFLFAPAEPGLLQARRVARDARGRLLLLALSCVHYASFIV